MKKVKKSPRVYPEGKVHTLVEKNHFSQKIAQKLYKSTKTNSRGNTSNTVEFNSNAMKSKGYI